MTKYTFEFPKPMGGGSVTLKALSAEEALQFIDAFGNKPGRLMDEMIKAAIIELDGASLGANRDQVWNDLEPKKRALISAAFAKISTPSENEEASFFATMQVSVD